MKKAVKYTAAVCVCVMLTGCASDRSSGIVNFFNHDYFYHTTTTQTTTEPTEITSSTTVPEVTTPQEPEVPEVTVRPDTGDTLRIVCFNEDVYNYLGSWKPSGVKFDFQTISGDEYYNVLDDFIDTNDPDKLADIYIVSQDRLGEYLSGDRALPVSGVNINKDDTGEMYDYTLNDCTDEYGRIVALSVNNTPGVFLYNRTVARRVLGTDDPAEVFDSISNWRKFLSTASEAKRRGFYMTPNYTDMFRAFGGEAMQLTDSDGNAAVKSAALDWAEVAKTMYQNDYCTNDDIWTQGWISAMNGTRYFGMFACSWMAEMTLPAFSSSTDWAVCQAPAAYSWDGAYAVVNPRTDNAKAVEQFLRRVCVNGQISFSSGTIIPNNKTTFRHNSQYNSIDCLGGQEPYEIYNDVLERITSATGTSPYDYKAMEFYIRDMKSYITGNSTIEQALDHFQADCRHNR